MMQRIYDQQLSVVKDFFKHLQDLHDQGNPPHRDDLEDLKKLLREISKNTKSTYDSMSNGGVISENRMTRGLPNGTTALEEPILQNGSANNHEKNSHKETSQPRTSISKSTLDRAQNLVQWITLRRDELQDYEDTTKDISNQVRYYSLNQNLRRSLRVPFNSTNRC